MMTSKFSTQDITDRMIRFIYAKKIVHYTDLEKYFGRSRATISKYLDQVEEKLAGTDVKLIRKRNKGIYLKGDVAKVITDELNEPSDPGDEIISYLLGLERPILLDELAEKLFLSRSTLIRKLNVLRDDLGIVLVSSKNGVWLDQKSVATRQAFIKLLQERLKVRVKHQKERFYFEIEIPDSLQNFCALELLATCEEVINEFQALTHLKIQHYDFKLLLLQTALALQAVLTKKTLDYSAERPLVENTLLLSNLILEKFEIVLPESELAYLNKTIILIENSDRSNRGELQVLHAHLATDVSQMLESSDATLIRNLVAHIKLLLTRSYLGVKIVNPYADKIKRTYPLAMEMALTLASKLTQKYEIEFDEDEVCFLALHFESYIERKQDKKIEKLKVIIVCSTGYGSAQLLKQQLEEYYGKKIEVLATLSVEELMEQRKIKADLVISTIPLKLPNIPSVQVTPFLTNEDQLVLDATLQAENKEGTQIFNLLKKDAIVLTEQTGLTPEDAIKLLLKQLTQAGYVKEKMLTEALKREKLASTGMGTFAIPHGKSDQVISPVIGVLIAPKGIKWGRAQVKIAFFLALDQRRDENLEQMYRRFYQIIRDPRKLRMLYQVKDPTEFLKVFSQLYQESK